MPPGFTQSLANRLNQTSSVHVKEAEDGEVISAGKILVAPSGLQTRVYKKNSEYYVKITDEKEKNYLYKPCVDLLFSSAAESGKDKVLGIIMTGMGNDGSKGCIDIHHSGGMVIAQSEETCVISTMPNSAIKEGIVDKIVPLDLMAKTINNFFKKEPIQEL